MPDDHGSRAAAIMVEVGTTNKTHLSDYEDAINENTAALLKVHTSNFRVVGFTEERNAWQSLWSWAMSTACRS